MLAHECGFWDAVGQALQSRGMALRLITHNIVKGSMRTPYVQVSNGLDAIAPTDRLGDVPSWLDVDALLAREALWRGGARNASHEAQRIRALGLYARLYETLVQVSEPGLCVIWNGHHPQEMVLRGVCERHEIPTLWLERGPIPGTLQLDDVGVLGGSSVASLRARCESGAEWIERARDVATGLSRSAWEQPASRGGEELRRRLGIRESENVVLFAGQVDSDAQSFLYGCGGSNEAAFGRFLDALSTRDGVFVIGKHHPRSDIAGSVYSERLRGRRGIWLEDVSIHDCLEACDRVACVNSTVMYEALCVGKPVMSMGMSVLSGKGIAYRFGVDAIESWLGASGRESRSERWIEYLAFLLEHHLFAMCPDEGARGLRAASGFADAILSRVSHQNPMATHGVIDEDVLSGWTGFGAIGGTSETWDEVKPRVVAGV
ncbi:MAG: hypothetical protein ACF8GE_00045 [Phycisphaerales bacterium JB043]